MGAEREVKWEQGWLQHCLEGISFMGRSATCFPGGSVLLLLVKRNSAIPHLLCAPLPAAHIPAAQGSSSSWSNPLYPLNPFDRSLYSSMSIYFTGISVDQQMSVRGCPGTLSLLSVSPQLSSGRWGPAFLCAQLLSVTVTSGPCLMPSYQALPLAWIPEKSLRSAHFSVVLCSLWVPLPFGRGTGRMATSPFLKSWITPHTTSEFSFLGRDRPCSSVLAPPRWVQLAMRWY